MSNLTLPEPDPLITEATALRFSVVRLTHWIIGLVATVAVGTAIGTTAITFSALQAEEAKVAAREAKVAAREARVNTNETRRLAAYMVECTTPSERDAQGNVTVPHPCWDQLRMPVTTPGVAPTFENLDCLVRRALANEPPPANYLNCPAG